MLDLKKKKEKDFDHLVNVPLNKMYVIIIYWWCTPSMIYKLNFCYMLKGIQESNFCNNIQGFQCHFSQLIGAMLNVEFFFLILLKFCCLTLKQLWFCINQNKYVIYVCNQTICYICLQSIIVVSHHRMYLLPPRLKCSTFNVSIITIQMVITPRVWPLQ